MIIYNINELFPTPYSLYDILNENNINTPIEVIDWNK